MQSLIKTIVPLTLIFFTIISALIAQDNTTAEPSTPPPLQQTLLSADGRYQLEQYFEGIEQGGIGVLRITGDNIQEARAIYSTNQSEFIEIPGNGWYAFVVVSMDYTARTGQPLDVIIRDTNGVDTQFQIFFDIWSGTFIRQDFELNGDREYLIDPEIERNEYARIGSVAQNITPEKLWSSDGFTNPINSEFTSPFGVFRVLNNSIQTRHTGWDQNASVGTPVYAISSGKVAFAGKLDIRGNYVLIDHGMGIYSGYAHFSRIDVTRGQSIQHGQVIGLSGNTGRSNGPHLHWEILVNGEWINNRNFVNMWLP